MTELEEGSEESSESEPTLVRAIARAHAWVKLIIDGVHTSIESLASIGMHQKSFERAFGLHFSRQESRKLFCRVSTRNRFST